MNPLLAQFLVEAREQIAATTDGLLGLERAPEDAELLKAVFRSVHTLKGSSGLFDFPALTAVLHAGEDLLVALREQGLRLDPAMLDQILAALDLVAVWFDCIEDTGGLPNGAEEQGRPVIADLRAWLAAGDAPQPAGTVAAPAAAGEPPAWLAHLPAPVLLGALRHATASGSAVVALSYRPEAQCFFKGDDPFALMLQLPECLHLGLVEPGDWPALAEYDPFSCLVGFQALSSAPKGEVQHLLRYVADQTAIFEVTAGQLASLAGSPVADKESSPAGSPQPEPPASALPAPVVRLLHEQAEMLRTERQGAWAAGCIGAATKVAANALRYAGRADLAGMVSEAGSAALTTGETAGLIGALGAALAPPAPPLAAPNPVAAPARLAPAAPAMAAEVAPERGSTVLRVDQARIDALMNLIGELVVAKNGLPFLARRAENVYGSREMAREIKEQHAVIDRIALELRTSIMQVRMLPVSTVFQRFPRLVRDLSRKLGKSVELAIEGEDTQADKTVIENLFEPLLHLVRNSLDHGIEGDRAAAGKPEVATLTLAAVQDNDQVIIRVRDDGRGIDPAAMRRKALERGLLDEDQAARLSDADAVNLIFAAGFSTAAEVTDVSGRGVGMDAVRTAIEKAGGWVEVSSTVGAGTVVSLHLPLSMAVTRVMTLTVSGRQFGVPMDEIAETVRIPRSDVVAIKDREAFLLRDRIIPLVHLDRLLDLPPGPEGEEIAVLVVRIDKQPVGLAIGAFGEGMEVIVKPLEGPLAGVHGYLGTALLGDGRVLLVLNLKEIVA